MPEGTEQKSNQLTIDLILEMHSLVHAFPQPLLAGHVPVCYLLSHVDRGLDHFWMAGLDQLEVALPIAMLLVGDARCVDGTHAQFPAEVVFKSQGRHAEEGVIHDVPETLLREGRVLSFAEREEYDIEDVEEDQDERISDVVSHCFPGRRNISILILQVDIIFEVLVRECQADRRARQELAIAQKSEVAGQPIDPLLDLLLGELMKVGVAILDGEGKERILVDIGHHNGGYIHGPSPIINNHAIDMVDGQQGQRDDGDLLAAVLGVQVGHDVDEGVQGEDHPDVAPVDEQLDQGAQYERVDLTAPHRWDLRDHVAEGDAQHHRGEDADLVLAQHLLHLLCCYYYDTIGEKEFNNILMA